MQSDLYGILLVSFSPHSHQRNFVPLYQAHPRLRLIAVTDEPDIDDELVISNRQWAADLGIPYIEGVDAALARNDVDIVSIGHEIERRADLIIRAAHAGKHLWIDKFIGASINECDSVVDAVNAANIRSVIPSYTYSDLVRQSRQVLADGQLGELMGLHVDALFAKSWPQPLDPADLQRSFLPPSRWKFSDLKRELLTVGAYAVGLVQTCLSPIVNVCGHGGAHFFPEHAARGAEDFGTLTMTDEMGRCATICGGRIGIASHPAGGPSQAHLIGSHGSAFIDGKRPYLNAFMRSTIVDTDYRATPDDPMQWASGPPNLVTSMAADSAGLATGLQDLVTAIDSGKSTAYSVSQARDHMEILLAGYLAIVNDTEITLPLSRGVS